MSANTTYDMVQSDAFSDNCLCKITMFSRHECLHFNDPSYIGTSMSKSDLPSQLFNFISLPACEKHPMKEIVKNILGESPFDLPHVKTVMSLHYQKIPGIRVSEFNKSHKRVAVSFELSLWATIGQLKLMKEEDISRMHIEAHTPVGTLEL